MVQYVGFLNPSHIDRLLIIKPYDEADGKGYQRPVNQRRTKDLAQYLSHQQAVILPPILLNAAGNWEYVPDNGHGDTGTLICTGPASIIDGQHRIEGIKRFLDEYSTEVRIPFCAIHNLDENEEIETFLIVNTTAKPIQKSHVHYLEREKDPISWVAAQLATDARSPFYGLTAITGVRQWRRGWPVTLQNLVKMVTILYRKVDVEKVPQEAMLEIALTYFSEIKSTFPEAWKDVKHHGLMQIAVLNALAMVAAQMIDSTQGEAAADLYALKQSVANMKGFDWSRERFKGLSGPKGSETIQVELLTHMAKQSARRGTE
jgi:DNA sulfur modification protein DndB